MHNKQQVGSLEGNCETEGAVAVNGESGGVGAKQDTRTEIGGFNPIAHVTHIHLHNTLPQHHKNTPSQHHLRDNSQLHCTCQSHLQHANEQHMQHACQQHLRHTSQKLLAEQGISQLNPKRPPCLQQHEHHGQHMGKEHMYQQQQHVHDHCLPYQQSEIQTVSQDKAFYRQPCGHSQPQQNNHPQLQTQLSQVAPKMDNLNYSHVNTFSQNPSIHHSCHQSTPHSNIPHSSKQPSDLNHISNIQPSHQLDNYHQSTSITYTSKFRNSGLSYSVQELQKEKRDLEERLEEARARRRCVVCLDADYSALFLPCLHLVTCPACAVTLATCPVCRAPIQCTVPVKID